MVTEEESDDASELSIGSGGASGHTRPKPPPPTPFMDETADIKEGPIALYRKGRLESLYRPVIDRIHLKTVMSLISENHRKWWGGLLLCSLCHLSYHLDRRCKQLRLVASSFLD